MIVDHQRRFMSVILSAEPSEDDLRELGGLRERWLLYRDMVRKRMRNMIASGLPRSVALLGTEAYGAHYDAWLDEVAPRTRYIREIVPAFADHVVPRLARDPNVPRFIPELVRYEATWWRAAYDDSPWPTDVEELAFEKRPVLNPTVALLRFEHRVHEKLREGETDYAPSPVAILVYRNRDDDKIYTWVPSALCADLVEGFLHGEVSLTDVAKRISEARGVAIDAKFVENLGTMLADLVTRTVLLGSR
jgi:hypothetical protein